MFDTFLNQYNGQRGVGNTPENKGECVGLVMVWIKYINSPHIWGHAKDILTNADRTAYEVILNTPSAVPQKGDVVVWSSRFNGTYGHTAIATGSGNINIFEVFEQNNPVGNGCRLHSYNYNYVTGWLRPKKLAQSVGYMYTLPSGKQIDIGNMESNKVTADMWDQVVNRGMWVKKFEFDKLLAEVVELRKRPVSCPPQLPQKDKAQQAIKILETIL